VDTFLAERKCMFSGDKISGIISVYLDRDRSVCVRTKQCSFCAAGL